MSITFSFLHATARLPGWEAAYRATMLGADRPDEVEYILAVDAVDAALAPLAPLADVPLPGRFGVVINGGVRASTPAYNVAAWHATGRILVVAQDDVMPPPHWDTEVLGFTREARDEWVLWVRCGSPRDGELMGPQILSRARYARVGWIFCPEYRSMYADDEFTQAALADNVVIDARDRATPWIQAHPSYPGAVVPWDAVYSHENSDLSYEIGYGVFTRRKALGFPGASAPRRLSVCLPGESFSHYWLASWTSLFNWMTATGRWDVRVHFGATSDVYLTRNRFVDRIKEQSPWVPELVLWIDDDNLVTPVDFQRLVAALDSNPDAAAVAAWCWMYDEASDTWLVSCYRYNAEGVVVPMDPRGFNGSYVVAPFSGFPCVLHRYSVLDKLPIEPFSPYPGKRGEDTAFCQRLLDAGEKLLVHTGVEVPHLKLHGLKPNLSRLKGSL